jgi:hypothetical protein
MASRRMRRRPACSLGPSQYCTVRRATRFPEALTRENDVSDVGSTSSSRGQCPFSAFLPLSAHEVRGHQVVALGRPKQGLQAPPSTRTTTTNLTTRTTEWRQTRCVCAHRHLAVRMRPCLVRGTCRCRESGVERQTARPGARTHSPHCGPGPRCVGGASHARESRVGTPIRWRGCAAARRTWAGSTRVGIGSLATCLKARLRATCRSTAHSARGAAQSARSAWSVPARQRPVDVEARVARR